jgi:hypothetical protein
MNELENYTLHRQVEILKKAVSMLGNEIQILKATSSQKEHYIQKMDPFAHDKPPRSDSDLEKDGFKFVSAIREPLSKIWVKEGMKLPDEMINRHETPKHKVRVNEDQPPSPPWINLEETLPEPLIYVLTFGHSGTCVAYHIKFQDVCLWFRTESKEVIKVTHWMPLPNSPELKGA